MFDDVMKLHEEFSKLNVTCKNCGHRLYIPTRQEREICSWCGKYVFRDEKEEFKYRLLEEKRRNERTKSMV